MATVQRFEDLDVWKKARELTKRVYQVTSTGPSSKDFGFRDQIRRAAVSVMLNISEGFEKESGDKDFRHYLSISKGSAGEVRAALYIGLDCGYFNPTEVDELMKLTLDVTRMLSRFISYLATCMQTAK